MSQPKRDRVLIQRIAGVLDINLIQLGGEIDQSGKFDARSQPDRLLPRIAACLCRLATPNRSTNEET